ncbi:hypothetical protein PCE1_002895 [Barthelona sp. PCE]
MTHVWHNKQLPNAEDLGLEHCSFRVTFDNKGFFLQPDNINNEFDFAVDANFNMQYFSEPSTIGHFQELISDANINIMITKLDMGIDVHIAVPGEESHMHTYDLPIEVLDYDQIIPFSLQIMFVFLDDELYVCNLETEEVMCTVEDVILEKNEDFPGWYTFDSNIVFFKNCHLDCSNINDGQVIRHINSSAFKWTNYPIHFIRNARAILSTNTDMNGRFTRFALYYYLDGRIQATNLLGTLGMKRIILPDFENVWLLMHSPDCTILLLEYHGTYSVVRILPTLLQLPSFETMGCSHINILYSGNITKNYDVTNSAKILYSIEDDCSANYGSWVGSLLKIHGKLPRVGDFRQFKRVMLNTVIYHTQFSWIAIDVKKNSVNFSMCGKNYGEWETIPGGLMIASQYLKYPLLSEQPCIPTYSMRNESNKYLLGLLEPHLALVEDTDAKTLTICNLSTGESELVFNTDTCDYRLVGGTADRFVVVQCHRAYIITKNNESYISSTIVFNTCLPVKPNLYDPKMAFIDDMDGKRLVYGDKKIHLRSEFIGFPSKSTVLLASGLYGVSEECELDPLVCFDDWFVESERNVLCLENIVQVFKYEGGLLRIYNISVNDDQINAEEQTYDMLSIVFNSHFKEIK